MEVLFIYSDINLCVLFGILGESVMPACPASFFEKRFPTSGNDD